MSQLLIPDEGHMSVSVLLPDAAGTYELAEQVATEPTSGLVVPVPDNSSSSVLQAQGGNTDVVTNDAAAVVAVYNGSRPVQPARALWTMALLTMIMDVATALYKPARGVLFGRSKLAYYLALAIIFVAGLAEAFAAFCLSRRCNNNNTATTTADVGVSPSAGLPFASPSCRSSPSSISEVSRSSRASQNIQVAVQSQM